MPCLFFNAVTHCCDPLLCLQYAREAANRWQDNVFALQSWCKAKFAGREGDVDTFFKDQGFNEDAEYFA